jgi:hypothetical protein
MGSNLSVCLKEKEKAVMTPKQKLEHQVHVLELKNKQLQDSNKLVHVLICAILSNTGPFTVNKSEVFKDGTDELNFNGYAVNFKELAGEPDKCLISLVLPKSKIQ